MYFFPNKMEKSRKNRRGKNSKNNERKKLATQKMKSRKLLMNTMQYYKLFVISFFNFFYKCVKAGRVNYVIQDS